MSSIVVESRPAVDAGLHEVIRKRWSPRAFSARPVSREDLRLLLEAARWAPSSYNEQPWRFVVAERGDEPRYEKLLETLAAPNRAWARQAPVLLLTVAKTRHDRNGALNRHAWHDVGLATGNLLAQASALGIHAHLMGGFDPEKARAGFALPEGFEPVAVIALGYAAEPEPAMRSRLPLESLLL
jgi:nitroreductase